jgi:hypothetical protein
MTWYRIICCTFNHKDNVKSEKWKSFYVNMVFDMLFMELLSLDMQRLMDYLLAIY